LPWNQNGWWQTRIFPYEKDGEGWQISTSYSVPFTSELSLGGFADINFVENGKDRWVIEPQLTHKMSQHLSLALEYRYNGFEDANPLVKGSGVALGLEVNF
jgi:nucleoside-specific outer membrane channel protein Tsx